MAEVRLVVTQPDRPRGRGLSLAAPRVKTFALEHGLPVAQPSSIRTPDFAASLRQHNADVGVVVAYGRILPAAILNAPKLGCLNVHASLLPRLRGAAPVHWAIVRGQHETGVSLMQMDEGMDTGPVLAQARTQIGQSETAGQLAQRLAVLGAQLLAENLLAAAEGRLEAVAQDPSLATRAPLLKKQDGRVCWAEPAVSVFNHVRGMSPWPGAFARLHGKPIKLHRTHVLTAHGCAGPPGRVVRADAHGIDVACGQGVLAIEELQPAGRRRMHAREYLAGHALERETLLT
ncbi:MAG: methionyl-tRNA formyltransferase [Proteobacteria bacterium]|nr:methionyl-tRNA formyltransferase [Pseudomonadota bacterium]